MQTEDHITVRDLRLVTTIGATAAERSRPQSLALTLHLWPKRGLSGLGDQLENTVNYSSVAETARTLAATGERVLVETLADEIAAALMEVYPLRRVTVQLAKFVIPDAASVRVSLTREHKGSAAP